ncbi:MAG: hypothetical protein ACTH0P_08610 [Candidatus Corynebacterium faecigallinarum]|uniref:hypothetical protein n=1 Tax=Candidatus Corynebacterium faecigallinarum TaxID=2838528 RepID=UPI003FB9A3BA
MRRPDRQFIPARGAPVPYPEIRGPSDLPQQDVLIPVHPLAEDGGGDVDEFGDGVAR